MHKCEGCNCWDITESLKERCAYIVSAKHYEETYEYCPCQLCLVKMICTFRRRYKICGLFRDFINTKVGISHSYVTV